MFQKSDRTPAGHPASSSSSQPVPTTSTWIERINLYFPGCTITEDHRGLAAYFFQYHICLDSVLNTMSSVPAAKILNRSIMLSCEENKFSSKGLSAKQLSAEKIKMLFEGIEMHLRNHSDLRLDTLIHYRLPSQFANELYNYALQGSNTIPILYWALICEQPITGEMLIGITVEQLDRATRFAANIDAIDVLCQLKRLNESLDLTSACLVAIHRNSCSLVEKLLELGVDTKSAKSPLLHAAVRLGDIDMARLLLQHNANINALVDEKTPLHLAVSKANIAMIKLLLFYGADINFPAGAGGITALHLASVNDCPEVLGELLSTGDSALALSRSFYQSPFDPQVEAAKNQEWNVTSPSRFFQPFLVVSSIIENNALSQALSAQ